MVVANSCVRPSSITDVHVLSVDVLILVTGGMKGLGAHTRSLITEERYTPSASTNIRLSYNRQNLLESMTFCTYLDETSRYPKKMRLGSIVMKNVCVPRVDVFMKYISRNGVRTRSCVYIVSRRRPKPEANETHLHGPDDLGLPCQATKDQSPEGSPPWADRALVELVGRDANATNDLYVFAGTMLALFVPRPSKCDGSRAARKLGVAGFVCFVR